MQVRGIRGIRVIRGAGWKACFPWCLAGLLAAGCHGSKQAEASSVMHSEAADSVAVAARTVKRLERTESGALRIDLVAADFCADSIRIRRVDGTETVIYGPRQSSAVSGIEQSAVISETAADSSAVEAVAAHHELADSAAHEARESETTAVARPPSWLGWLALAIGALAVGKLFRIKNE